MTYLDNRTILEKADLALADLTAGGGILSHGVASGFATLGYSKGGQRQVAERIGTTIATLVTLGNISFPIAVLAGVVHL